MGEPGRVVAAAVIALLAGCSPISNSGTAGWGDASSYPVTRPAPVSVSDSSSMRGDGTFNMGGMDGKDWGQWVSMGAPTCEWSIRSVSPYNPAEILDSGAGINQRVGIQPDGSVDVWSGEIGGHRIVFVTYGCSSWRLG